MGQHHDKRFPNESDTYREARDGLLSAEADLRRQVESVAAMRRSLPLGGELKENYVFDDGDGKISFSDLFAEDKDILAIYSFMYAETPCPSCTSMLDGLNGAAPHIMDRMNLAVVAKAPIEKISTWASSRGWRNLSLLSSGNNTYNTDYFTEAADGSQLPMMNVFQRKNDDIYHTYSSELFYAPGEEGMHPRHIDMLWPVWNVMDLTPMGRGTDWFPKTSYE